MKLRHLAEARPVPAALLCAGLQFGLTLLILKLGRVYAPPEAFGKVKLLAFASTVILPLLLTHALGMWREVGFGKVRPNAFFLASLLPVAMWLSMGMRLPSPGGLGADLLIQAFNGFGEELLFRGVIFVLLLRLPVWQAIVLNGLLFGSMHLIHGYMDGSWSHAALWALKSACAGMMFTAVRLRTDSLWLVVVLHMVLNLATMYSNIEFAGGPAALQVVQISGKLVEAGLAAFVVVASLRKPALA